jgi:hypothetical protein
MLGDSVIPEEHQTTSKTQYIAAAGLTTGAQHAGFLREDRESHWCYPLFHLPLQSRKSSITCITLSVILHHCLITTYDGSVSYFHSSTKSKAGRFGVTPLPLSHLSLSLKSES